MQTPLEMYESQIRSIDLACEDPWFTQRLADCRSGDDLARTEICSSCLNLVLDLAKRRWQTGSSVDLVDLIQQGNTALVEALAGFAGSSAQEFKQHVEREVEARFDRERGTTE